MADAWRTIIAGTIAERTSALVQATLQDELGAPIAAAQVTAITLTLCVRATGAIINARQDVDVLTSGMGTIDPTTGRLSITLRPEDNVLSTQTITQEEHAAVVSYTWDGGAKIGRQEILFTVANVLHVS